MSAPDPLRDNRGLVDLLCREQRGWRQSAAAAQRRLAARLRPASSSAQRRGA